MSSPLQQSKFALWEGSGKKSLADFPQHKHVRLHPSRGVTNAVTHPHPPSPRSDYGVWASLQQHVMCWDEVAQCSPTSTFTNKIIIIKVEEVAQCNTNVQRQTEAAGRDKKKSARVAFHCEFTAGTRKADLQTVEVGRLVAALRRDFLSCCERWSRTVRRLVTSVSHWPLRSHQKTLIAFLPSCVGLNTSYDTFTLWWASTPAQIYQ